MRRFPLLELGLLLLLATPAPATERVPEALPGALPFPAEVRRALAAALAARPAEGEAAEAGEPRTRHRTPDGAPRFTNRLLLEASPYLRQHAHNPVNWYPWGDEAFEAARRLGRPVLVSIGYATCHWCHVMEEESFDDVATARLLNERFVAVKVDREVRPDVDAVYMAALTSLSGRGGWPLNVFVTPAREPFYGGTYFPPHDARGRPSFRSVLRRVSEAFAADPHAVARGAGRLTARVREQLTLPPATSTEIPGPELFDRVMVGLEAGYDEAWGGLGLPPKFPAALPIRFLLRRARAASDPRALEMAVRTLERMADGGVHDQIGGGFHRYAMDRRWRVPHFEKMLYDNARLAVAYLEAWQSTGRAELARVARGTLDYLLREMASPEGAFFAATDADSAGPDGRPVEGRFFTWTPEEVDAVLGPERGARFRRLFGVTAEGDLDGRSVLHRSRPPADPAGAGQRDEAALRAELEADAAALRSARSRRPPPLRDEKILAGWNGLAISALARAGLALDEPRYLRAAERAADFVLTSLRSQGRLARSFAAGRAEGVGLLEDHAFVIAGLLDLYESASDPRWLREALALQAVQDAHFADADGGGYFRVPDDADALVVREKPAYDGAEPSGNSVAVLNLLRLAELTGRPRHRETALAALSAFRARLEAEPVALGEMLLALDFLLDTPKEVLVVRGTGDDDPEAMLAPLRRTFCPNRVLAVVAADALPAHLPLVPLLAGKRAIAGRTTAFVCEHGVCGYPARDPETFARQLADPAPRAGAPEPITD